MSGTYYYVVRILIGNRRDAMLRVMHASSSHPLAARGQCASAFPRQWEEQRGQPSTHQQHIGVQRIGIRPGRSSDFSALPGKPGLLRPHSAFVVRISIVGT
ncbi:hypothetical protein LBW59_02830 [Ralstonia solanacearum]|uniref:Uncharacterized protein n=1 Tax=Ralstonia solanacearum TaxID=305 RepID=A0AAW5ZJI1_RALSL|nr:hypothetical protein [Ralstonia solanacearum]MBB6590915.1 hypothetical protein [Ralstonia solanacearum]MBB6595112.1 hypothetical protein [Ralstonia solanacearum]MDB0544616.1 hypothetical protein [Ralstonia solanacearum]MDB0554420.1 hypothetical protein [Ralstonia solanacearum]MDB0559538.1 hypothetical protein [Ralstonia solanacearum]